MLQIRTAGINDFDNIKEFYYSVIDELENAEYSPEWKKDIYPAQEYLLDSIKNNELYIGETDGSIASCMVVDHKCIDGYKNVSWSVEAEDQEIFVIHILGVLSEYSRRGIATQMVQKVIEMARENGVKTIRLDILEGNLRAEKTYIKSGFRYVDTVQMFYEDTGWTSCKMFEYIV